jgi:hypothetical protein
LRGGSTRSVGVGVWDSIRYCVLFSAVLRAVRRDHPTPTPSLWLGPPRKGEGKCISSAAISVSSS